MPFDVKLDWLSEGPRAGRLEEFQTGIPVPRGTALRVIRRSVASERLAGMRRHIVGKYLTEHVDPTVVIE